jgi:hypothetical protein
VRRAAVASRGVHGERGQGTVEWVALVLLAALVLTGAGALASSAGDTEVGELIAKRIARPEEASAGSLEAAARGAPAAAPSAHAAPGAAPAGRGAAGSAAPAAAPAPAPRAPAPAPPAPAPASRVARRLAVDAFRRLRGFAWVARRAWIACLGYRRWRYELEHPSAPGEALPLGEALAIANDCLNPHDYLFED